VEIGEFAADFCSSFAMIHRFPAAVTTTSTTSVWQPDPPPHLVVLQTRTVV
jgi:hypothetical protein